MVEVYRSDKVLSEIDTLVERSYHKEATALSGWVLCARTPRLHIQGPRGPMS